MITRRTKDILVRFTIPLPRRWWLRWTHTPEARSNMSAAQQQRHAKRLAKAKDLNVTFVTPDG